MTPDEARRTHTVSSAQVLRENLATILGYALSIEPLSKFVEAYFEGEWTELRRTIFELPRERAERACLELALFLRYMDDEH